MHTKTIVRHPRGAGAVELVLAGSSLALLLILSAGIAPERVGLLAAGLAAMHAVGRMAAFGLDREVSALLPRQKARRARRQLVLAGQHALVRHAGLVLGAAFAVAVVLEATGSAIPASAAISVGLGAVGIALFDYATAPRPAGLGQPSVAVQRLSMPISRVAIAAAVMMLVPGRPELILLAYALATLAFGLPPFLWAERRLGRLHDDTLVRRLLRRTTWRGLESAAGAFSFYAGTIVLAAVGRWKEAAVYAVALALAATFRSALLPFERSLRIRAARLRTEPRIVRFLTSSMASGLGLSLLGLPAVVVLGWWLPLLFPSLAGLRAPLWLLAGTVALQVVEAPIAATCRALRLPRSLAFSRLARLALVVALGLAWAPGAGATGAALAQLTACAASLAVLASLAAAVGRPLPPRAAVTRPGARPAALRSPGRTG